MTEKKNPTRAEQRAQRLAELKAEMDRLNAEKAREETLIEELPARGLARSRAAVALYDLLGVGAVRRDEDDEKRAQRLVDEVTKLASSEPAEGGTEEQLKQLVAKVERERDFALLTIARLRNVQGDREHQLVSAGSIANEVMGAAGAAQQRPTPAA